MIYRKEFTAKCDIYLCVDLSQIRFSCLTTYGKLLIISEKWQNLRLKNREI